MNAINFIVVINLLVAFYFLVDSIKTGSYLFTFIFGLSFLMSVICLVIPIERRVTTFKEEYKLEILSGGKQIKIRNQEGKIYTCKPSDLDSVLTLDNL